MADTGLKSPTATGEDFNDWDNPTWAYASDNNRADGDGLKAAPHEQDYYNFTFGVPDGATIDGVEVVIEAKTQPDSAVKTRVELSWDGGANYTAYKEKTGWPSGVAADATKTFGANDDLWGRVWASGEFSNANFRVKVYPKGPSNGDTWYIDHLQVRVTYTEVGGPAGVKTINDVAIASVKTINDEPIAEVKTINDSAA